MQCSTCMHTITIHATYLLKYVAALCTYIIIMHAMYVRSYILLIILIIILYVCTYVRMCSYWYSIQCTGKSKRPAECYRKYYQVIQYKN